AAVGSPAPAVGSPVACDKHSQISPWVGRWAGVILPTSLVGVALMRRFLLLPTLLAGLAQAAEPIAIDVYRDPNCGCCSAWIDHLEQNGFAVADHVVNDMAAVKLEHGVPHRLGSCHTGVIDGKFVEGHVPAADILKLRAQPDLI